MLNDIVEFISKCEVSTNTQIYNLFEGQCSSELRELIYNFADPTSPEPLRSAMYNLGFINY
jgi:hypothetical protein